MNTAAEVAWNKARKIPGQDPEHTRQDKHGLPMWRERFNLRQMAGWAVNERDEPEAFRLSGQSVDTSFYLPSEIGDEG